MNGTGNRYGAEAAKTPKATVYPTVRDIHWAAGFIEGEGCFGPTGCLIASQVQKEPLEKLQRWFGGRLGLHAPPSHKGNPFWTWGVHGARARGVGMTLYQLLSPKRREQFKKMVAGREWMAAYSRAYRAKRRAERQAAEMN